MARVAPPVTATIGGSGHPGSTELTSAAVAPLARRVHVARVHLAIDFWRTKTPREANNPSVALAMCELSLQRPLLEPMP